MVKLEVEGHWMKLSDEDYAKMMQAVIKGDEVEFDVCAKGATAITIRDRSNLIRPEDEEIEEGCEEYNDLCHIDNLYHQLIGIRTLRNHLPGTYP